MNSSLFKKVEQLEGEMYEMEFFKTKVKHTECIQLGLSILCEAKRILNAFYYDCIQYYFDKSKFNLILCDTDSIYLALTVGSLEEAVKPERIDEYKRRIYNSCHDNFKFEDGNWFIRQCCEKHKQEDQFRPSMAKVECEGREIISLASKTYVLDGMDDNIKLSCKGISKKFVNKPLEIFRDVLTKGVKISSTNRGFICKSGVIYSYKQDRVGFNFMYMKRQVLADSVSTVALQCRLTPWEDKNLEVFDRYAHPLSNLYPCKLNAHGITHKSAEHMFQFLKAKFHKQLDICDVIEHEWNVMKVRNSVSDIDLCSEWFDVERLTMKKVLNEKFKQNQQFRNAVIDSKGKTLVYAVTFDRLFGAGITPKVAHVMDVDSYPGQNLLCDLIVEIRELYLMENRKKKPTIN